MKNLAIFFSGNGTNMQALVKASQHAHYPVKTKLLICNNETAKGLQFAKTSNIALDVISNEKIIYTKLVEHNIDYIALAGYDKIISPFLIEKYKNKIFNIHPSLLPLYRGKNAVQQALTNNAKISGCTVHLINEKIDQGIILAQTIVPILHNDSLETLQQRILRQEHIVYANAIKQYISNN